MSGANLTGLDLSGLNLSVTNLTGANLTGAQLQNVTVNSITEDATTFGGQLGQANLTDANLTGDNLSGATLTGANFSGTVLVPSNQTVLATSGAGAVATWPTPPSLPGATPGSCTPSSGSTFPLGTTTVTCQVLDSNGDVATGTFTVEVTLVVNGCTIVSNPTPTNFTNCPNTGFAGADLTGVNLSYANLAGSTFAGCTFLPPISCTSATLNGATLTQANLSGASFVSCGGTLTGTGIFCGGASLTNATLIQANLSSATFFLMQEGFASNFPGVDLSGANLSGADLAQANVTTMVNFSNANLSGANLTGTSFGDNLTNADLTGANLTNASMEGTVVTITVPATLTGAILTGTLLVPSNQTVTATSPAGAVVTWSTPAPIPGATPGTCTPASGSTFPLGTTTVTCQVLDASGDVATGTFTVSVVPPPTTFVGVPSNGATVSGDIWLDAGAQSPVGVASVTFELSGGAITNQVISGSTPTIYGYLGAWNSTSVPNGTYTLQSVATDVDGVSTTSAPVTISVNNPPPSTSVVIPSDGATQSGTTALLDASSTADVTSVSYELSGGTLTNQSIATGTPSLYGWLAEWNTTSVPNGTYTLQSVGTTSGGTVTSTPITITVSN
jgi:uncharacterized protein YjbI with pentapeptide repeats